MILRFNTLERKWKRLKTQDRFRRAPILTIVRLVSWRARCLFQKLAVVKLRRWKVKMFLPVKWEGIGRQIFAFREDYEPELAYLESLLSPGKTFIDVGANLGIYTLVASRIVGEAGRVLAFEPSAQSFPLLRQNIALNGLRNVLALPVALSQKTGTAQLFSAPDPSGNSFGKDPLFNGEIEEVVTDTLDNVLRRAFVREVDVIKMDVQGAEELVLRGASRLLCSMRPVIIFEVYPSGAALLKLSKNGALDILKSYGYAFMRIGKHDSVDHLGSAEEYFNVVAVPERMEMRVVD